MIPPAWTDVWISTDPRGHLQATGRDARGRRQYRYHPRWREVRDDTKYHRMCYIHPAVFDAYLDGSMLRLLRSAPAAPRGTPTS